MEVILRQDVEKVGLRGEVVDVAPGFARNYLLPRKLAEAATPAKVAELRKHEDKRARHEAQSFEQAQEIVEKLEGAEIRFDVPAGETGTLFGSVTATLRLAVVPEGGELPPQEELDAIAAAEAEAEAAAQAEADAEHEQAEAEIEAVVVADEEELEPDAEAEAEQVPEDAFDRAADAADELPGDVEQPDS